MGGGAIGTGIGLGAAYDMGLKRAGHEPFMEKYLGMAVEKITPVSGIQRDNYLERIYDLDREIESYKKKLSDAVVSGDDNYKDLWERRIIKKNNEKELYRGKLIMIEGILKKNRFTNTK